MFKLSPSDFAYLYEECKLCFYLKVKHGIALPSMPLPAVFSAMNTRLQTPIVGKELQTISKNLPEAVVKQQEGWVESKPVEDTQVYIKGKYDLLAERPDGSYILIDLKISSPHEDKIEKFKSQLGAYKYALENPARGKPISISMLGLLIFYPDKVELDGENALFRFPASWYEVPIDDQEFIKLMKEIEELLSGPTPEEGKDCKWCKYRHRGEEITHLKKTFTPLSLFEK